MEIEGSDGSKTLLKPGSKVEWGRDSGFKSDDRKVSRRHLVFELNSSEEPSARFQVLGKNPIWVHRIKSGEVSTFKPSQSGEMERGDMFCASAKNPIWFALEKAGFGARKENNVEKVIFEGELAERLQNRYELKDFDALEADSVDISEIGPVKEFGIVVFGKEFDSYGKKMIRDIKKWNWFLDENGEQSEDDEFEEKKRKKGGRRKRKKSGENEDEDWTGESEEEKELLSKAKKVQKPKYLTRLKDRDKLVNDSGKNARFTQKKTKHADDEDVDEEEEEEDADDETLGGFIVDNDEIEEEGEEIDEEKEEEFDEDEEELDD